MSMRYQSRPGARGGQGDFKWEDVKGDKYRENYLGHSVMAPVGRWQKGRDLTWYTKDKDVDAEARRRQEQLRVERELVKQQEQDLMAEAMGYGKARRLIGSNESISKEEMQRALNDDGDEVAEADKADRVSGLGFAGKAGSGAMAGLSAFEGGEDLLKRAPRGVANNSANLAPLGTLRHPVTVAPQGATGEDVAEAATAKKHKKEKKAKKEKKKHKKEKKREKERHRSRSPSRDHRHGHTHDSRRGGMAPEGRASERHGRVDRDDDRADNAPPRRAYGRSRSPPPRGPRHDTGADLGRRQHDWDTRRGRYSPERRLSAGRRGRSPSPPARRRSPLPRVPGQGADRSRSRSRSRSPPRRGRSHDKLSPRRPRSRSPPREVAARPRLRSPSPTTVGDQ